MPTDARRPPAAEDYGYVLSADGLQVSSHGRAPPALLPRADSVVAVLADSDVSWHRITLPKAPAARLRAALGGVLEEQLLEDDEALHLALAPGARAGEPVWVAAMHKPWLRGRAGGAGSSAGLSVERVLPPAGPAMRRRATSSTPAEPPATHARILLCHADAHGLSLLRLRRPLARALLPR